MEYQVLFSVKNNEKVFINAVCCSQDWCFKVGLVGCFGFNAPLRQYFSPYLAISQREGGRKDK